MRLVLPEPVSTTIWRYGFFEEDVSFYMLTQLREGDTFIDVGGHFGFFSLLAAELVGPSGRTVTFEPMPQTRRLLSENLADYIDAGSSEIVPMAAGRFPGELEFKDFGLVGSAFATSADARHATLKASGNVKVTVDTIDNVAGALSLDRCDLIKIDAENAEEEVIAGAAEVIKTLRPALIVEMGDSVGSRDSRSLAIIELLCQQGYEVYEFRHWQIRPHIKRRSYTHQNLLFKPL